MTVLLGGMPPSGFIREMLTMQRHPLRCLLLTVLLCAQSVTPIDVGGAQAQAAPAIDAAALTLRPGDVPHPGWVHDGAFVEQLDREAANQAAYLGRGTTASAVAQQLTAFGWRRMYVDVLILPSDASAAAPLERIRSSVTDYATAEGAAAGFAYLEDVRGVVSAKVVPGTRTYGEQSAITSDRGVSSIDGRPYRSLDLTFRVGTLVAGVTLAVYPSKLATTPDQAEVEALGAIMEARVTSPPADGAGLGRALARLRFPGAAIVTYDDAYYRIAGTNVPISGETKNAAASRALTYQAATDVYQLWQGVDVGAASGFLYGVTLLHFPSDAAAAGWVTHLQTILGENPFYAQMRPVSEVGAMGDHVLALSYVAGGGGAPRSILIAVRVGDDVARVQVVPQGRRQDVPLAPVEGFAKAEASCLEGTACADIIALPPGMAAAAPAATPVASPVA